MKTTNLEVLLDLTQMLYTCGNLDGILVQYDIVDGDIVVDFTSEHNGLTLLSSFSFEFKEITEYRVLLKVRELMADSFAECKAEIKKLIGKYDESLKSAKSFNETFSIYGSGILDDDKEAEQDDFDQLDDNIKEIIELAAAKQTLMDDIDSRPYTPTKEDLEDFFSEDEEPLISKYLYNVSDISIDRTFINGNTIEITGYVKCNGKKRNFKFTSSYNGTMFLGISSAIREPMSDDERTEIRGQIIGELTTRAGELHTSLPW